MSVRQPHSRELPPDDQGAFADLDRIRIDMLDEAPPEPAEQLFHDQRQYGVTVLPSLSFFRWILHRLYNGNVYAWEASLERRDERLQALTGPVTAAAAAPVLPAVPGSSPD